MVFTFYSMTQNTLAMPPCHLFCKAFTCLEKFSWLNEDWKSCLKLSDGDVIVLFSFLLLAAVFRLQNMYLCSLVKIIMMNQMFQNHKLLLVTTIQKSMENSFWGFFVEETRVMQTSGLAYTNMSSLQHSICTFIFWTNSSARVFPQAT